MRFLAGLLVVSGVVAQDGAPAGIVKGELIEWRGSDTKGEISLRAPDHRVYWCSFDEKTYFERDGKRTLISKAAAREKIELLSDRGPAPSGCYARLIRVMEEKHIPPAYKIRTMLRPEHRSWQSDTLFPRGNLTFAGVVLWVRPELFAVRMNGGEQKKFVLREDTRYAADGQTVNASMLEPNTRVFIRAGKNLDDQLEAFLIVWGRILLPGGGGH